ncbi:hypothetical protein BJ973_000958 [Actinoplanes tereljensis]|uniref:Uncharacterized protein n=1 Tax=Paractinoplanes tereljensis TaxID=571912 RepID=A0A919NXE5_9ACTN|nr:hypothetical protein [Actinoplanes tereljensis]GIF26513.1 hypothetical protein Ate02nite_92430 [Actinoplanes tereljensis]
MRHSKFRRIAAAGALALIVTTPLAACGDPAVSPRPAEAATPSRAPASAAPKPAAPKPAATRTSAEPVRTRTVKPSRTTTKPKPTGTCLGAVRYDLDLRNTVLDLVKSMCFHTGGVLRLQGIGPGLVTATPESLRSQSYEGGVVDIRFLRPGTVTVMIPQDDKTYTIEVVVIS